jgi:ABC-type branched-subunit amino acid transport system ATPase component
VAQTILSGRQIRKSFNGVAAVDDVSFSIEENTITAIIGPNGAGKTTLFNLLTGFIPPDQGTIFFKGRDLNGTAPHKIMRLGIARTFQDLRLLRQIPIVENLLLACPNQSGESFLHAVFSPGVRVEEAQNHTAALKSLDFVGLKNMATEPAGSLSYGQQKLLSLACCLATEGNVLLLDEPVSGVHPEMAGSILDLMVQLRNNGKTIIFIEHDIEAVRKVAQHILVMDEGKIIASGSNEEVLTKEEIIEAYLT